MYFVSSRGPFRFFRFVLVVFHSVWSCLVSSSRFGLAIDLFFSDGISTLTSWFSTKKLPFVLSPFFFRCINFLLFYNENLTLTYTSLYVTFVGTFLSVYVCDTLFVDSTKR